MSHSIATVCLSGSLETKLRAAAKAGFSGVEIFEPDLIASELTPEQIRDTCAELGLNIDMLQPFRDAEGVSDEAFERVRKRAKAKFALMNRLGTDLMLVCSNVGTASVFDDEVCAKQLYELAELARTYGVRLAYEALAWGRYVNTYEHAWRIVQRANHQNLGVCLDSFHVLSRRSDPAGFTEIPAHKIFYTQLADAPRLSLDVLSWSRHHRVYPGQGALNVAGFVDCLRRAGYQGPLSLEIFNDVFRAMDPYVGARNARRSLLALDPQLPKRQQPLGIDFAELRATTFSDIHTMLSGLGAQNPSKHIRKQVERWEVGAAHVFVSATKEHTELAPTCAALALRYEQPDLVRQRAKALHIDEVRREQSAEEAELFGLQAPEDTEVFLTSTATPAWEDEFTPLHEESADNPACLTGIDHVALGVPIDAADESMQFYRTVLGLLPKDALDVADPSGLVKSQAFVHGEARVALNVLPAQCPRGSADSTEHIALSSSDIFASAKFAQKQAVALLRIPANYYEDLAARCSLDAAQIARLKAANIMFDEDEQGQFYQFYTERVGHMFFEVVQRVGGYTGFGAANAPVRRAALQR